MIADSLAQWAWGMNPSNEISPEICLTSFSNPCLIALLVKAIGLAVICGAFLSKAPIIINILKNRSVAGMSSGAVYGETIMYSNAAFYSYLRGNPFTAYGENAVLTIQTLLLCILLWKYKENPKINFIQIASSIVAYVLYIITVLFILHQRHHYLLMTCNLPVLIYSRGCQILTFLRCRHTGTQSLITTVMNLAGSVIRIFTTLQEVGFDITLLGAYGISVVLNCTLVIQFIVLKDNTKKYLQSLEIRMKKKKE